LSGQTSRVFYFEEVEMISLPFILVQLFAVALYDSYRQNKSESVYWYEGKYVAGASEASSIGQFGFWYFYVFFTAFTLFPFKIALINIGCIAFLHWCGVEDLFYYFWSRWIVQPDLYFWSIF
jgi:hypothetical protein